MKKLVQKCGYKLVVTVVSIYLISTITFFLFELMPGDIYSVDYIKNENVIQNIIAKYGLNEPVWIRYIKMLVNLIHFDFGNSFISNGISVNSIIFSHAPISAWLGCTAFLASSVWGILIGGLINKTKHTVISKWLGFLLIICYSLPTFEIAALAQYFLCVRLSLFPIISSSDKSAMFLPIVLMSVFPMVNIARLTAAQLNLEDTQDYVLAARLRKTSRVYIFFFYKLKNSIAPIMTLLGTNFASLVAGSFVIETMFSIPGLGRYFITSILNRDYPLVMGLTIFYSSIIITINFIAELASLMFERGKSATGK